MYPYYSVTVQENNVQNWYTIFYTLLYIYRHFHCTMAW